MPNILLLEDDIALAGHLCDVLEEQGHCVKWCKRGNEAFAALQEADYDMLITDVFLHDDGKLIPDGSLALLRRLRKTEPWASGDFPILAITGDVARSQYAPGLDVLCAWGAQRGMRKPFSDAEFTSAVSDMLEA